MWLLLPVALLMLTLLALAASNLQRGFRSNWLLSLGGTALAWLSLLVLRFRLPQSLELPAWWAGQGLDYAASFTLAELSWPLGFVSASLLAAALLGQVRSAMSAAWFSWIPGLAIGAAALLATFSGDWLTFAYTTVLVDLLAFSLFAPSLNAEQRSSATRIMAANLAASLLLVTAWALSFYGAELEAAMVMGAVILRLGLWNPQARRTLLSTDRLDLQTLMVLVPLAPGLALAGQLGPSFPQTWGIYVSILVLVLSIYYAIRWYSSGLAAYWQLALAGLALFAGLSGHTAAILALGPMLLLGGGLLRSVQQSGRYRLPAALVGAVLLSGLPYTGSAWFSTLVAAPVTWLAYIALAIQATLVAGWLRYALQAPQQAFPPEPWMRSVRWVGLAIFPLVWVLLGIGLLPHFEAQTFAWWPGLLVLGLAALVFFSAGRLEGLSNTPFSRLLARVAALPRPSRIGPGLARALSAPLDLLAALLEGRAGIFWAMLFMALLLTVMAQFGIGV